jgi:Biotin-requiring enzyme
MIGSRARHSTGTTGSRARAWSEGTASSSGSGCNGLNCMSSRPRTPTRAKGTSSRSASSASRWAPVEATTLHGLPAAGAGIHRRAVRVLGQDRAGRRLVADQHVDHPPVEGAKVEMEVESPADGSLVRHTATEGDVVPVGAPIATLPPRPRTSSAASSARPTTGGPGLRPRPLPRRRPARPARPTAPPRRPPRPPVLAPWSPPPAGGPPSCASTWPRSPARDATGWSGSATWRRPRRVPMRRPRPRPRRHPIHRWARRSLNRLRAGPQPGG